MRRLIALLAAPVAAAAAAQHTPNAFVPVFEEDFADPFMLVHKGEVLAYSTNREGVNLPMAVSRDLVAWQRLTDPANPKKAHDAFPKLGAWAKEGFTWAPEVMRVGDRWLLYYTARDRKRDKQCLGLAVASDPRGPFRDEASEPFVCQTEIGGTIDANPFRDADGKLYLYYKNDGNSVAKPTHIWGQRLSADGMKPMGEPVAMMRNDQKWEAHVIEAPTMVQRPGGYTMLYSAHHFGWEPNQRLSPYAMGYATCSTPLGPCTDAPENPILYSYNDKKAGCLSGPGHQSVVKASGATFLSFHAWSATGGCRPANKGRFVYIAQVGFDSAGKPLIAPSLRRGPEAKGK